LALKKRGKETPVVEEVPQREEFATSISTVKF